MTRENFAQEMNDLRGAYNNCIKYYESLHKLGVIVDDAPAFEILDVALSAVSKEVNDKLGYVQFFVWDMEWGEVDRTYDPNSDEYISIHTPEELYDYIQSRNIGCDADTVASNVDLAHENDLQFIWGVKSKCDVTDAPACLYSTNDIDIVYNKTSKMYMLGIETMISVGSFDVERDYLLNLLDEFEQFMVENGYDTTEIPTIASMFGNMKFVSIEQAYATFKMIAVNYLLEKTRKEVIKHV